MLIPIWYADWEYECCGSDVVVGDVVEWMLYWRSPEPPVFSDDESPHIMAVWETDIEAVWRWRAMRPNANGVNALGQWGNLVVGVCLPTEQRADGHSCRERVNRDLNGRFVLGRGRLWREHHVAEPIAATVGTVRQIYRHPQVYRRIDERHSEFERHEPGIAVSSTAEAYPGDMRFMVEINVEV